MFYMAIDFRETVNTSLIISYLAQQQSTFPSIQLLLLDSIQTIVTIHKATCKWCTDCTFWNCIMYCEIFFLKGSLGLLEGLCGRHNTSTTTQYDFQTTSSFGLRHSTCAMFGMYMDSSGY